MTEQRGEWAGKRLPFNMGRYEGREPTSVNSAGVVRCVCAMCSGNYACGGDMADATAYALTRPRFIGIDWAKQPDAIPNRLYGTTINSEGDAV